MQRFLQQLDGGEVISAVEAAMQILQLNEVEVGA